MRYSQQHVGGTARYVSMGGAFGALGGDLGAVSSNPAALGVYRRGEISFTPALFTGVYSASLENTNELSAKPNMNFANLGYAKVYERSKEKPASPLVSTTLGLGFNRLAQYHSSVNTEIVNTSSSLADQYAAELNNGNIDPVNIYEQGDWYGNILAWNTFLVDTVNGRYASAVPPIYGQTQRYQRATRGRHSENYVGLGFNFNHKVYVGATMGFSVIRYTANTSHAEFLEPNPNDTLIRLESFTVEDDLTAQGFGYNLKLGAIWRASRNLRLGAALHTPTVINMVEEWSTSMETNFEYGIDFSEETDDGYYEYRLRTPWRANVSAAWLFGKMGLVTADYEIVDYASARFSNGFDGYGFAAENTAIGNTLGFAQNIRVGTEVKLQPIVLRLGYAMLGTPFTDGRVQGAQQLYSGGIGYRTSDWYVDAAYQLNSTSSTLQTYSPDLIGSTDVDELQHHFLFTVGFRM